MTIKTNTTEEFTTQFSRCYVFVCHSNDCEWVVPHFKYVIYRCCPFLPTLKPTKMKGTLVNNYSITIVLPWVNRTICYNPWSSHLSFSIFWRFNSVYSMLVHVMFVDARAKRSKKWILQEINWVWSGSKMAETENESINGFCISSFLT